MSCEVFPLIPIQQPPEEYLDYTIDWATRGLGTDTIISQTYSQSSTDFTLSQESIIASPSTFASASAVVFWMTGGIPGNYYTITNTITTSGGRIMEEVVIYQCLEYRLA